MRGVLSLAAVMLAAAALGCGGSGDTERTAAVAAFIRYEELAGSVPPSGVIVPSEGKHDCVLVPGDDEFGPLIGKCEWEVAKDGDVYTVTVTETWKCSELNARLGSESLCQGEQGSHRWHYSVLEDGEVGFLTDSGDPPPEALLPGASNR